MRPWTMTRRLIGVLVALIGSIWLVGVGITAISIRHEIDEVFDSSLQETAQRILPLALDDLGEHDEETAILPIRFPAARHREHLHYQVRNAAGRVILRSHDAPAEPFAAPLRRGYFDGGGRRYFTEVSPDERLYVQVAEVPEERQEAINALWFGLATPLLGLLPIIALVIYWTVHRTTRPIIEVQSQIRARDGENLAPIDPRGLPGELKPIIRDTIGCSNGSRRRWKRSARSPPLCAHELRNPIAAAHAQAELIAQSLRGSPEHARAMQLIEMLARLGRRIEKVLQLARVEAGIGFARIETDLVAVTRHVVEDYGRKPHLARRLAFDEGPSRFSL